MRSGNPVSHPPWIRKPQGSPPSSITRRLLSIRLLPSKYTARIREKEIEVNHQIHQTEGSTGSTISMTYHAENIQEEGGGASIMG